MPFGRRASVPMSPARTGIPGIMPQIPFSLRAYAVGIAAACGSWVLQTPIYYYAKLLLSGGHKNGFWHVLLVSVKTTPAALPLFIAALTITQISLRAMGRFNSGSAALLSGAATAALVVLLSLVMDKALPGSKWLLLLPAIPAAVGGVAMATSFASSPAGHSRS